jgi:phosphatidylserine decarboxylase
MTDKKVGHTSSTSAKGQDSLLDTIKDTVLFPIHKEGWKFIIIFAVATILLGFFEEGLLFVGVVLTGWCVFFFRNPERMTPTREGLVISPAFGKICDISYDVSPPSELSALKDNDDTYTRVSIFLSVFDVHVNRIPIDGKIIQKTYRPGKFVNAATDKASTDNEMAALVIETTIKKNKKPHLLGVCQIAGWVARRIVTTVDQDTDVKAGQELGIIRFGSRADIYLPKGANPLVSVGQRTVEGETVIADFSSKEEPRDAEKRGAGAEA